MSPDTATAEPGASTAAAAPAPTTESAPGTSSLDRLPSIAEAFRAESAALKGSSQETPASADEPGSDAPGASAAPAASKPGEDGAQPSRRGAAARISEQQQEIERLVQEREAERARAAELQAYQEAQVRYRAERANAAMQRIGDDRTFAELSSKRMRGEVLSYEQDEQLNSMLAWREHAADLWEIADRAHKQAIVSGLSDRTERYGLDKQVAYDAPLPDLLDHAVSVTEARVRKESANEIAELKAELKGWRARGGGGAVPTVGGASTPPGPPEPDDDADPRDWLRAGLMEAEAERVAATRGGRPRR